MTDKTRVFNADCLPAMRETPDKFYDLAIVDVNYGIEQDGRNNHTRGLLAKSKDYRNNSRYDNDSPDFVYFEQLRRITKNQIVWGANHFISKIPLDSSCWIVWDKDNGETDFADCELAWTSFDTAVRKFKWKWQGMLQEDMKNKQERIHPNEKPIALYKWLLHNYAKSGDKILDTHLGSQSSRIAAFDMGFDFTGYELDKDYFEAGNKRFEQHKSQLKLFPVWKYTNLLGEEIDTEEERKKQRGINPMVKSCGKGPPDKKCKRLCFLHPETVCENLFQM